MHFCILFCLYHQALSYENKYKNTPNKPVLVRYMQEARGWRQWYWEKICDLKRRRE